MYNQMSQVHPRATTRSNANRIHTTTQKQPTGFRGFAQHKGAIGRKAFWTI